MDKPRRLLLPVLAGVTGLAILVAGVASYLAWRSLQGREVERESHAVIEAVHKVARLTTVEMNVSSFQRRRDAKNLLGFIPIRCEKTVAVFYRGRVAAGFDLQAENQLTVTTNVSPRGRTLSVELPAPRLLYVDAPAPEVVVADGSVCNRFEPADYEKLHAEARGAMESEALGKGILTQAETHARELLTSVGSALGYEVEVKISRGARSADSPDRSSESELRRDQRPDGGGLSASGARSLSGQ
ncbi:MAG TPA: DUF4230 domain-containing protein [Polyangia bacterium]